MLDRSDDTGQVLLTSAFLFAIIITIIALMLNNVIYATNIAYMGFIDGSKYEDQSIRHMTEKEAICSFDLSPNLATRTKYMSDYEKAINSLTSSKGTFIQLTNNYYPIPEPSGLTFTETQWGLTITNKDTMVKYLISTGSTVVSTPLPDPTLPTMSFNLDPNPVTEGDAVTVNVVLSNPYDSQITLNYDTPGSGTAVSGVDYTASSGTISFDPGETIQSFSIATHQNSLPESDKDFAIAFTGYITATVMVTIHDDDQVTPTGTPVPHAMKVHCVAVRGSPPDAKEITIVVRVENTGENTLNNVQIWLVSPSGIESIDPTSNPYTIGTIAPGTQSAPFQWKITMKNSNEVYVMVKAVSDEITTGVLSDNIQVPK